MAKLEPRQLLRREITYSEAKSEDTNILQQLTYVEEQARLFGFLAEHDDQIKTIVGRHLRLSQAETCSIPQQSEWLHGSFNVGIPVTINGWRERPGRRVLIRFPLPYKIGESFRPGNADEKLRCEVATYAWIDENCPDVPIPHLWGFAFSTGRTFSALEHAHLITRCFQEVRRGFLYLLGYPVPSRYIPLRKTHDLGLGYLLTDFIEECEGKTLVEAWPERQYDNELRANLFKDLSRMILSLGRIPLPRIGSFTIDDFGYLSLTNRPLTLELHQMENGGIPIDIPRNLTYTNTELYVRDLLHCHRTRVTHQPNAIHSRIDGLDQLSALTVMDTVFPHFFNRALRHGPFGLTLTDVHFSNVFVDKDWHITRIVDLEWACARPLEMQHPPYWLSLQSIDEIDIDVYDPVRQEFMDIFEQEEARLGLNGNARGNSTLQCTDLMRTGWSNGQFWYCLALDSPTGLHHLLYDHIQPIFHQDGRDTEFYSTMPRYWIPGHARFINQKVEQEREYQIRLQKRFEKSETLDQCQST